MIKVKSPLSGGDETERNLVGGEIRYQISSTVFNESEFSDSWTEVYLYVPEIKLLCNLLLGLGLVCGVLLLLLMRFFGFLSFFLFGPFELLSDGKLPNCVLPRDYHQRAVLFLCLMRQALIFSKVSALY